MSALKIGGAIVALGIAGAIAVAHHGRADDAVATEAQAHEQPADGDALQGQLSALFTLVYQHADFDAVETHLVALIRENPEAIGGDAEAFAAHVSDFLHHVQEQVSADPATAGEHTAHMLIEAHQPQE